MRNKTIGVLLLLAIGIFSCKKDHEDGPAPEFTGYWRGHLEQPVGAFISVINHDDGGSRAYFASTYIDTSDADIKMSGKWKVKDGVFHGTYTGPFFTGNDTVILQGLLDSRSEMHGLFMFYGSVGGVPMWLIKQE